MSLHILLVELRFDRKSQAYAIGHTELTHLLSRDMSSLTRSRTGTFIGTLIGVRPGSPGKGKFTVIVPPATLSFVVVITSDDGGRDMNPRTPCARCRPPALRRLCRDEVVNRAPSLLQQEVEKR